MMNNQIYNDVDSFRKIAAEKLKLNPTAKEKEFIKFLNSNNIKYEFNKLIKRYIVDFYLSDFKIVIELDGRHHKLKKNIRRDLLRDSWLWRYGYKAYRFENCDILKAKEFVLNNCIKCQPQ